MTSYNGAVVMLVSVSLLTACVTIALAPGADKVRVTSNPQDVAPCTAVGNVRIPQIANRNSPPVANPMDDLRNQAVGLGGNTVFVTSAELGEGVAYRCP